MRILVAGDAMRDVYWFGTCHRISPEAPVPVVTMGRIEERAGAAANVAANCKAMGADVVSLFGGGEPITKVRVIAKSQQVVRVDFDKPQDAITREAFTAALVNCHIVVFSDYAQGSLKYIQDHIHFAKKTGRTVLVDPKGHDYERYRGADLIKPNTDEMREMVGGWGSESELLRKAHLLRESSGIGAILLTRAAEGMTLVTADGEKNVSAESHEVFDVSGAGDTAIAALAVSLSRDMSLLDSIYFANRAAGIAVGRFGTAVVNENEVFG